MIRNFWNTPRRQRRALLPLLFLLLVGLLSCGAGARTQAAVRRPRMVKPVPAPRQFEGGLHAELVEASSLIKVGEARGQFGVNGNGMAVAVLDTGIRATHRDFSGRVVAQRNFTADNGGDQANAADGEGHGTNVSGIVAANGVHVGMAPGANIVAVKVLDNSGSGSFDTIAKGLQWVIDNRSTLNITVVNMSLGDNGNYLSQPTDDIQTAIRTLRNAGVAVCVAAGNGYFENGSKQGMSYPAIFPETVSVSAVYDANLGPVAYVSGATANSTGPDRICPFAQRLHSSVSAVNRTDIFAPGARITSTGIGSDSGESSEDGTSQATPVTAGVILLMQEYYKSRKGSLPSVDQLEKWLRAGAVSIKDGDDEDDNVTHTGLDFPRVNALAAMQAEDGELAGTYSVSGTIKFNDAGLAGVKVSAGGKSAVTGATGAYTITGLAAATYSVVPTLTGFSFTPTDRSVTVGPDRTGVDFTASGTAFSISGTVTLNGAGLAGVKLTAGGQNATTDAAGKYTLSGLPAGSYTIAPALVGYAFNPASQAVTVGPSKTGVDFAATALPRFQIQGQVSENGSPLAGVTISAGGKTATTAGDGTYTVPGLLAGTYEVAASKATYAFNPHSLAVTVGPDATDVNFVASRTSFNVTGLVTLNGVPLPGVAVSTRGISANTGTDGTYTLSGLTPGAYTLTAAKDGYVFTPSLQNITVGPDKSGVNFTAAPALFTISGRVTQGGAGLSGATLTAGTATTVSGADGTYTLSGLLTGSYTVRATLANVTFTPATRQVSVGPNATGVDFATAALYRISGRVSLNGLGLAGVTVKAGTRSGVSDANGNYVVSNLATGTYTVTPSSTGYTFSPGSSTVSIAGDLSSVNFAATAAVPFRSFKLNKSSVVGGKPVTGTVTLGGRATGDMTVILASSNPGKVPIKSSLVVRKGQSSASVTFTTVAVTSSTDVTLTATLNGVSRQAALKLLQRK